MIAQNSNQVVKRSDFVNTAVFQREKMTAVAMLYLRDLLLPDFQQLRTVQHGRDLTEEASSRVSGNGP